MTPFPLAASVHALFAPATATVEMLLGTRLDLPAPSTVEALPSVINAVRDQIEHLVPVVASVDAQLGSETPWALAAVSMTSNALDQYLAALVAFERLCVAEANDDAHAVELAPKIALCLLWTVWSAAVI